MERNPSLALDVPSDDIENLWMKLVRALNEHVDGTNKSCVLWKRVKLLFDLFIQLFIYLFIIYYLYGKSAAKNFKIA